MCAALCCLARAEPTTTAPADLRAVVEQSLTKLDDCRNTAPTNPKEIIDTLETALAAISGLREQLHIANDAKPDPSKQFESLKLEIWEAELHRRAAVALPEANPDRMAHLQ